MIRTKYKLRYYNANEVSCCSTPVVQTCFKQHSNLDLLNEKKPHIIAYVGLVSTSVKWGNVKTVFLTFPRSWIDCNLLCSLHVRTHTHLLCVFYSNINLCQLNNTNNFERQARNIHYEINRTPRHTWRMRLMGCLQSLRGQSVPDRLGVYILQKY